MPHLASISEKYISPYQFFNRVQKGNLNEQWLKQIQKSNNKSIQLLREQIWESNDGYKLRKREPFRKTSVTGSANRKRSRHDDGWKPND